MQLITEKVSLDELKIMAKKMHHNLVKAVVDIEQQLMMIDAGLHADQEEALLEAGSDQSNLWGINLHPNCYGTDEFVEFDSMINIRPSQGNYDRSVNDLAVQKQIIAIVKRLVVP